VIASGKPRVKARPGETLTVELFHRAVPVVRTPDSLRALSKDRRISPESVERYLRSKFGEALDDARTAMMQLARSRRPGEIAAEAYKLYEGFRPTIPEGVRGWGAKGDLELRLIRKMART
jgi:hypothetical protein